MHTLSLHDALPISFKLGFSKEISKFLVNHTFKGSISLLFYKNITAEKLVKTVATISEDLLVLKLLIIFCVLSI